MTEHYKFFLPLSGKNTTEYDSMFTNLRELNNYAPKQHLFFNIFQHSELVDMKVIPQYFQLTM